MRGHADDRRDSAFDRGETAFAVAAFREWLGPSPPGAKLWERPMPTFLLAITLTAVGLLLLP